MKQIKEQLPLIYSDTPSESFVYIGDALETLRKLPAQSCRTAVTSPPYWGLRDYEVDGQLGAEEDIDQYVDNLVVIFRELRRVLTDDGTFWLNIGDSYTSGGRKWRAPDRKNPARAMSYRAPTPEGLKPKDLVGVPWRVAFSLQEDGWYLRSEIIWHKTNPHPESVKDRPSRAHETIFMFSKQEQYYYDYKAIREMGVNGEPRNRRTVWTIPTEPFDGAHFATYPMKLIEPCILAGSSQGDYVLDPFFGSGTTGAVASLNGRNFIGIELNPEYIDVAGRRLSEYAIQFDTIDASQ